MKFFRPSRRARLEFFGSRDNGASARPHAPVAPGAAVCAPLHAPLHLGLSVLLLIASSGACSAGDPEATPDGTSGTDGAIDGDESSGELTTDLGDGGGELGGITPVEWPDAPVVDEGAPANSAELFSGSAGGTGPCVHEPQDGALIPKNWLRPRFRLTPAAGEDLFEITLTSDAAEGKKLVYYTTNSAFAMDAGHFAWIAGRAANTPVAVNVSIRATTTSGGAVSQSNTSFRIAPVEAGGSMVYWATKSSGNDLDSTKLVGLKVGKEPTVDALLPSQIQESGFVLEDGSAFPDYGAGEGNATCIGCHTSTPDGDAVAFNANWPWPGVMASVEEESVGQRPSYMTDAAATAMKMPFIGTFTFSEGEWTEGAGGKAIGVIQDPKTYEGWNPWDGTTRNIVEAADLFWLDLSVEASVSTGDTSLSDAQGTLWDFIPRNGDDGAVANPVWSSDGTSIVYASCDQVTGGHPGGLADDGITPLTTETECDVYEVPFNDGAGGTATALAAEAGKAEYYPDFSSDDQLVAYTRAPTATGYHYYRADGEIFVVPASGGDPVRLAANDPPANSAACPDEQSPGLLNSWPKWSPAVEGAGDSRYYWLIFSSGRSYPEQFELPADQWTPTGLDRRSSQLYLAAVVKNGDGSLTTFPAVYIWNQTKDTANLTPAWDEFKIPEPVVK